MSHSYPQTTPTPPAPHERGDIRDSNRVRALQQLGQSVWLDDLRRGLFTSGEFKRLIDEDGLRGVTSNPSIFEKAIAGSRDYLADIERHRDLAPMALYETLAISDIRQAADLLRPVYDATGRADGFASMEVSPYLGHDTQGTIDEARRLWKAVDRDNLMIKVPASKEGLAAIRQLTSEGINVNITLLFGVERYIEVAHAYLDGLSRTPEWQRLASAGARPQRLLWASTSTKNPVYRDVRYIETLIGRETINTMTLATIETFRDHGVLGATVEAQVSDARDVIERLERTGISLRDATDALLEQGLARFRDALDALLAAVSEARH